MMILRFLFFVDWLFVAIYIHQSKAQLGTKLCLFAMGLVYLAELTG